MSAWFTSHLRAIGQAFSSIARAPLSRLTGILVLALALSLPAGLYLLLGNLSGVAGRLSAAPKISVFMKTDAAAADEQALNTRLRQDPWVDHYQFVSRDEALQELTRDTGQTDVSAGLDQNPLPDAFVVVPRALSPHQLAHLKDTLTQMAGVDQVQYDAHFAERMAALLHLGHRLLLLVALLLGLAIVLLFARATRLQVLKRRDEILLCRLLGATPGWLRRPLLWNGLVEGLLAGVGAALILQGGVCWLRDAAAALAQLYGVHLALQTLPLNDTLILIGLAAALGWFGAIAATLRLPTPRN